MLYRIIKYITTVSKDDFLKLDDEACLLFNDQENALQSVVFETKNIKLAKEVFSKCKAEINIKKELCPCVYLEIVQYELLEWNVVFVDLIGHEYIKGNAIKKHKYNLQS